MKPTPKRYRLLWWASAVMTLATFAVPALVIAVRGFAGESALVAASESAFVHANLKGGLTDSDALAELTADWRQFHIVKAALAALLVLVLMGLASALRQKAQSAGRGRRRHFLVATYGGVVMWLLGAVTILLANVQGAVAPLASVASFLPGGRSPGALDGVLADLRHAVKVDAAASVGGLAGELLGDFTSYHAVLAVLAAVTGMVLATLALRSLLTRARLRGADGSYQPTWIVQLGIYGATGAFFLLVALANSSTWAHPVPALLASLGG